MPQCLPKNLLHPKHFAWFNYIVIPKFLNQILVFKVAMPEMLFSVQVCTVAIVHSWMGVQKPIQGVFSLKI